MAPLTWLLVVLGGSLGAASRYLVDLAVTSRLGSRLPWGTLAVNLLGSAGFGLLVGLVSADASHSIVALLGMGFCGAFTTASALAWEALALAERGLPGRAAATVGLNVVLGLALAGGSLAVGLSLSV